MDGELLAECLQFFGGFFDAFKLITACERLWIRKGRLEADHYRPRLSED